MKKIFFTATFFISVFVNAQDAVFSSHAWALQNTNPAFAGSWACGRAEAGYRLQWPKLNGSYQTYVASYDQYFHKAGGVGAEYIHDNAGRGMINTDRLQIDYAPYFALHKDTTGKGRLIIQPAFSVAYQNKTFDFSKITFGDMIDPRRGIIYSTNDFQGKSSESILDLSAGLLIYSRWFAAGLAVYHLNEPKEGFVRSSQLPFRYTNFAAVRIAAGANFLFVPSVIFIKQQDFESLSLDLLTSYKSFQFGIGYRNLDAMMFSAGYDLRNFMLRYSFDKSVNDLAGWSGGVHEIHFCYRFAEKKWEQSRTNLRWIE
ncbi:MAG TPA: PorP/SprF family type IX secretion system membrane protein [Bacteroidia bacterium]|jgi:type IX secretion system PorP/SprF family membrane protein|nr:PorP/SprF family type IX secretion system membrane protein [Bacteroidia bacterium]